MILMNPFHAARVLNVSALASNKRGKITGIRTGRLPSPEDQDGLSYEELHFTHIYAHSILTGSWLLFLEAGTTAKISE